MKNKLRLLIPPIIPLGIKKFANIFNKPKEVLVETPESTEKLGWCKIQQGILNGRSLYMNPGVKAYQPSMLQGTYDQFLFDYVDKENWNGKVIYDIGAHIGYHTLNFAHRVGLEGRIFSFEPHPAHLERLNMNLSFNADLASRISILPIALSNSTGSLGFFCNDWIEGGGSSASFIKGSSKLFPEDHYKDYKEIRVQADTIDNLIVSAKCAPPNLMKIDVEGAESLVVLGAHDTIKKFRPIIIIEVHSQVNMLNLATLLHPLDYSFRILKEEDDGRCFVAIEP